jgi:hypothetical protein
MKFQREPSAMLETECLFDLSDVDFMRQDKTFLATFSPVYIISSLLVKSYSEEKF